MGDPDLSCQIGLKSYLRQVTQKELKTALSALGLTQMGAARLFSVDGRTVRKWVAGDAPIPGAVALCLNLMIRYGVTLGDAESLK
jgi:DNA-binding transcriptional regulator YiaG